MTVQDAVITVNGELVTDRAIVKIGEKISFADHEMEVIEVKNDKAASSEVSPKNSDWMLISRNQEMKGQKIVIAGECTVGRAKDNTICIPVISLSRHHATLRIGEDGLQVEDQQSANGTFVNGKQLGADAATLQRGDVVAFDEIEFLVHGPENNIFSEQTSVRAVGKPSFATRSPAPTAIDRQKISIVQRKPESFTEKFQAIQEEQSIRGKTNNLLTSPFFWLACVAVIVIITAIVTASS
jgi:pSer/pThr/pTyr-binding forkhead associated (FHA) protein